MTTVKETENEETMVRDNTQILAESFSPVCNVSAFVEDNGDNVYFYLWFDPHTEYARVESCWVCNRVAAPEELDMESMDQGRAPRMEAKCVMHDPQGIQLLPEELSIVWLEEGDGAALMQGEDILALIPGWAGQEGFHGYSRYVRGRTPFGWELGPAEPVLKKRVERSKSYWDLMGSDYWTLLQSQQLKVLEDYFGEYENYYAINGGHFPPKALVTGVKEDIRYASTVGVCALVQPRVEMYHQQEADSYKRIELAFACRRGALSEEEWMGMLNYIAGQSSLPWAEVTWLGHGHTIPCDALAGYVAVGLLNSELMPESHMISYGQFAGQRINPLWMVPLTQEEYDRAQEEGLSALRQTLVFDRQ